MNVNGSRFDLLLGRGDWGRCLDGDGEDASTLAAWWGPACETPPSPLREELPGWDCQREELMIQPVPIELPRTPGEASLTIEGRRGAAADRYGNVYRIADDRHSLVVFSSGSRRDSTFWPAEPSDCSEQQADLEFLPVSSAASTQETYLALAVTADDYLVVAFEQGMRSGFLSFDLLAGGTPVTSVWPLEALRAVDMSARHGGGVWVLERTTGPGPGRSLLWELDCRLAVVRSAQPGLTMSAGEPDDFQPVSGPARESAEVTFPGGVDLARFGIADPIAVEGFWEGSVLVLERAEDSNRGRVLYLQRDPYTWHASPSRWLTELPDPAHDFVLASARLFQQQGSARQLFVATQGGNQARGYALTVAPQPFDLKAATELFPLRRFGGRALISVKCQAHYDSGIDRPVWTPIVQQPRTLFQPLATFVTPVFDSFDLGTTWDRVTLDACLPPGAGIEVFSRAGDERSDLLDGTGSPVAQAWQVVGTWLPEPRPSLRANGSELPWLRSEAARATRPDAGVGTWELLLQAARGRYLQLRIRLTSGNGVTTPRLRALRAWSPRFSYPKRFLPAVYREDPAAGPFLERWLANFESTLTHIEDKVATLQWLFDPRTIPAQSLAWLAEWFDVALDSGWDERRRRLFVRHAMDFFRWRGTVYGLRLALELAFDECFDARLFEGPAALEDRPQRIRIVEAYLTRSVSGIAAGAGLRDGLVQARALAAPPGDPALPLSLVPPADAGQAQAWRGFCQTTFGFVPAIGAQERARWQGFLLTRYVSVAELAGPHGTTYASFSDVPLPRDWPPKELPSWREDWRAFCGRPDGAVMRARWQDFLARRYRRIERLNRAWETTWESFDLVALPDVLPNSEAAQGDWLQFERELLAMHRTAHRFSVLLPVQDVTTDPYEMEARIGLARRIVELEKPAHTVYDVRFYWALFRVGEARVGLDTLLGQGSRAPELIPAAVLGRAYIGASFVGGPARPKDGDRLLIGC